MTLILLFLPLAVFWRPHFFFLFDDWTELFHIAQSGFIHYALSPNGEIWFPLFRIIFYGLVKIIGEHYGVFIALNCMLLGVNSLLFNAIVRRHVNSRIAGALSVVFVISSANSVIVWNAFYLCYLLSLMFFFIAWLCVIDFLKQDAGRSPYSLFVTCLASLLCHPYLLLAFCVFPLYAIVLDHRAYFRKAIKIGVLVSAALATYTIAYLLQNSIQIVSFAAPDATGTFNIFNYLAHLFYGAVLSPFTQLNFIPDQAAVRSFALMAGGVLFACLVAVSFFCNAPEKSLAFSGICINVFSFALVSLERHQLFLQQALSTRYGFFSIIGLLLVFGALWNALLRAEIDKILSVLAPACCLGYLYFQTLGAFAALDGQYVHLARASRLSYEGFTRLSDTYSSDEATSALLYPQLRTFTQGQAAALRGLLER